MITSYAPGTPCWADLSSPDIEASQRFYTGLFDWVPEPSADPEAGGYTTFRKDGKTVAAVGGQMSPQQPVVWTTYFSTPDADATATRVESAGGSVVMAPMDVMGFGRMAIFADEAGAVWAAWQPQSMPGAQARGVPGTMSWNELMTRDPGGAKEFYHSALGLANRDVAFDGGHYTLWRAGGKDVAGMMPMEGDLWPADIPPHWMVYFEVDDTDTAAERVSALGGTVSVPPTDTDAGRFAVVGDPHGAFFSVIKSNPNYQP